MANAIDIIEAVRTMAEQGLFASPLNNGSWIVGRANHIYHIECGMDHYKDPDLSIDLTLPLAVKKWLVEHPALIREPKKL